jgi:hypothetical protein
MISCEPIWQDVKTEKAPDPQGFLWCKLIWPNRLYRISNLMPSFAVLRATTTTAFGIGGCEPWI